MGWHNDEAQAARQALTDYYGTAAFSGMLPALMELGRIESMSDEEAIAEARRLGLME